jgi:hypothetical protein
VMVALGALLAACVIYGLALASYGELPDWLSS